MSILKSIHLTSISAILATFMLRSESSVLEGPQLDNSIRSLMRRRDSARRALRSHPSSTNLEAYRTLRNEVSRRLNIAKSSYLMQQLNSTTSPSQLWSMLRFLGLAKQKASQPPNIPLNDLNEFFISFQSFPFPPPSPSLLSRSFKYTSCKIHPPSFLLSSIRSFNILLRIRNSRHP